MWNWLGAFFSGRDTVVDPEKQPQRSAASHHRARFFLTRASLEAEYALFEIERTRLTAERAKLEAEWAELRKERGRLKAERTQFEAGKRQAARKSQTTLGQSRQVKSSPCEPQVVVRHEVTALGMIGPLVAADSTNPPSNAQSKLQLILDAVNAHEKLVESLEADARHRAVAIAPEVLNCLRKFKQELERLSPTYKAARLHHDIARIKKDACLLAMQERARWRSAEINSGTGAKSPGTPVPAEAGSRLLQVADRPLTARERYLAMEDPGQGGHRDLTRD